MPSRGTVFEVPPGQFDDLVLNASPRLTVVVDFWAEWCAPCRALSPILERVVRSYDGRAVLAKVNIEEDREVALRFGVQGIPAVKVFRAGQVVGEFIGALPEPQVARILEAAIPSPADELVADGDELLAQGSVVEATGRYEQALEQAPRHAPALLRLGTAAAEQGDAEKARELLDRIGEDAPEYEAARGMLASLEFRETCRRAGGTDACRERTRQDPDSVDARYELACCLAAEGDSEAALEEFLNVLTRDKQYRDGAAKEAMLRIFALVGPHSELANAYRRKLAAVLY